MNVDELRRLHETVWSFRQRMNDKWPTPNVEDALRFANCEASEAMDVVLRQNGTYVRHHDKDLQLGHELAQVVIMLLTALPDPDWHMVEINRLWMSKSYDHLVEDGYCGQRLDWINFLVADALHENMWQRYQSAVLNEWHALIQIGSMAEIDVVVEAEKELKRIETMVESKVTG